MQPHRTDERQVYSVEGGGGGGNGQDETSVVTLTKQTKLCDKIITTSLKYRQHGQNE